MPTLTCRLCSSPLAEPVIDLGATPLANAYLTPELLTQPQASYPLRVFFCERCGLLQLEAAASPDVIFSDYAYFSSVSAMLLRHSEAFAKAVVGRVGLSPGNTVIEIASNDGYLLQYFQQQGLNVLGVEPAQNIAAVAASRGIPTVARFFGASVASEIAQQHGQPSLLIANNVIAHVPDLNDFLAGLKLLLAPCGTLTIEFHHTLNLVEKSQFDNIYHEHLQYFSLGTAIRALAAHGLGVVDVEEVQTQGGSLRLYAMHQVEGAPVSPAVGQMLGREQEAELSRPATYRALAQRIDGIKAQLTSFLEDAQRSGKTVVAFGAAAKGNTLLNYCGINGSRLQYVVDSSPHKQGHFLPGSRLPIYAPSRIIETRPDYVLILPWNLCDEITGQMAAIRAWGGKFVVAVPELRVLG